VKHNLVSRRSALGISVATLAWATLPRVAHSRESQALKVHSESPLNAEPALDALVQSRITPNERFYIRNHGNIPKIEAEDFKLRIEGLVRKSLTFTLAELREKFKPTKIEATLTCAGNRRSEMSRTKPIAGVPWEAGAIGNAEWEGPTLAELLKAAEVTDGAKHVWFDGLDVVKEKDGSVAPFGGSIPIDKALAEKPANRAMVAWGMNGEALSAEHGFPLRTVVPGFIGARSVKWLGKITVSDRPSPNHYVAEAYKLVQTGDKDELARQQPIYEFLVNSVICQPTSQARIEAGKRTITGYATARGDATIEKVEVSLDDGRSWQEAELTSPRRAGVWQLWSLTAELTPRVKSLSARAVDSAGNRQPKEMPWNLKGYLFNGLHRVKVEVV
jgi:sulfite oxidase